MNIKKIFTVCLVGLIILFSTPITAIASDVEDTSDWQTNGLVNESNGLLVGGVRGKKTATPTEAPNQYAVTINVENKLVQSGACTNTLILIDSSVTNPVEDYKEIVTHAIDQLTAENGSKIALATIGMNYTQLTGFAGYGEKEQLKTALASISAGGGSYLEEGIRKGREYLLASGSANQSLLLLSAASPTCYSRLQKLGVNLICEENHLDQNWNITPVYRTPLEKVYNTTSYTVWIPDGVCQLGQSHSINEKYPKNLWDTAVAEGKAVGEAGIKLYTAGTSLDPSRENILLSMNPSGAATTVESAKTMLEAMVQPENQGEKMALSFKDKYSSLGKINMESVKVSTGEVSVQGGEIVWSFDSTATEAQLNYLFMWDVEQPEFTPNTAVPLGEETTIEYPKGPENEYITLKQPYGTGTFAAVYVQGVLVNASGDLINEMNEEVANPQQAAKTSAVIDVNNSLGVNQWQPLSAVLVPFSLIPRDSNYEQYNRTENSYTLQLSATNSSPVVYVPFVKAETPPVELEEHAVKAVITYFLEEEKLGEDIFETTSPTIDYSLDLAQFKNSPIGSGYDFDRIVVNGETVTTDEKVLTGVENQILVYYTQGEAKTIPIRYHVNGDTDYQVISYTHQPTEKITASVVLAPIPPNCYDIVIVPDLGGSGLPVKDLDEVNVYCTTAGDSQFDYYINFFKKGADGSYFSAPDKTIIGSVGTISPYITLEKELFSFETEGEVTTEKVEVLKGNSPPQIITFGETVEIRWGANTINIYYRVEGNATPEPPEPEIPNPPIDPEEPKEPEPPIIPNPSGGTTTLSLLCSYTNSGEKAEWTESKLINTGENIDLWNILEDNLYRGIKLKLESLVVSEVTPVPRTLPLGASSIEEMSGESFSSKEISINKGELFVFSSGKSYSISLAYKVAEQTLPDPNLPIEKIPVNSPVISVRGASSYQQTDKSSVLPAIKAEKLSVIPEKLGTEVTTYGGEKGYALPATGGANIVGNAQIMESLVCSHYALKAEGDSKKEEE